MATIASLPPVYTLSLDVTLLPSDTDYSVEFTNIIRLTASAGGADGEPGTRLPGIYLRNSGTVPEPLLSFYFAYTPPSPAGQIGFPVYPAVGSLLNIGSAYAVAVAITAQAVSFVATAADGSTVASFSTPVAGLDIAAISDVQIFVADSSPFPPAPVSVKNVLVAPAVPLPIAFAPGVVVVPQASPVPYVIISTLPTTYTLSARVTVTAAAPDPGLSSVLSLAASLPLAPGSGLPSIFIRNTGTLLSPVLSFSFFASFPPSGSQLLYDAPATLAVGGEYLVTANFTDAAVSFLAVALDGTVVADFTSPADPGLSPIDNVELLISDAEFTPAPVVISALTIGDGVPLAPTPIPSAAPSAKPTPVKQMKVNLTLI